MYQLDPNDISFPTRHYMIRKKDYGFGGDLSVERIWFAYQLGIFPWFNEGEEILWWCPIRDLFCFR
jgi:leucyl/phenylalanyl-tRNA--protein transferase